MEWQDECRARGGFPTVDPKNGGAPACRFGTAPNFIYGPAKRSLQEIADDFATKIGDSFDEFLGGTVVKRDEVLDATGISGGLTGVAGKVLGIPKGLVLMLALGGLAVLALPYVLPRR